MARDAMQLKSRSFADRAPIPSEFAFAAIHPTTHITLSTNHNPHLLTEFSELLE
jgi:hypothetical protein